MPLYDFECPSKHVTERVAHAKQKKIRCPKCGKTARRIISASGQYLGNQDASWLKSVLDVVDRENPAPHVQAFVKNPTRSNYKAWMKGEGIRPMDHTEGGAPPRAHKPEPVDMSRVHREVMERFRERNRVEVRG